MKTVYPIKDRKKISAMRKILAADSKRNELLFILGINTAFRISDLLRFTFADLYDLKGKPKKYLYEFKEQKTDKTKSLPIAKPVEDCLKDFIKDFPSWQPSDPIFYSRKGSKPMQRQQAYRILNAAAEAVGITDPIGTHTLRKSFAYHLYKDTGNIALVQQILNHRSTEDTLRYIGIMQEDIDAAYLSVNLG
jgi:integrase